MAKCAILTRTSLSAVVTVISRGREVVQQLEDLTSVFCHFMRMLHDVFTADSTTSLQRFRVDADFS